MGPTLSWQPLIFRGVSQRRLNLRGFPRSVSLDPFYSNEFENDNDSSQQQPTRMSQILYPFSGGDRCAVGSDMLIEGVEGCSLSTYTNGGAYSSFLSSNLI